MTIRSLILAVVAAVFFWGCGSTSKVEKTGTTDKVETTANAAGSATSTGLCKMWADDEEKKKVYTAYSLYREPFKQEDYKGAMENWQIVMAMAPGFRKQPFVDGEKMYKQFFEDATTQADKDMWLDKLFKLYDERVKCHAEEGKVLENKGKFMIAKLPEREAEAYQLFEKAMGILGNETSSVALLTLFNQRRSEIKEGTMTEAAVKALGDKIRPIAEFNIANGNDSKGYYKQVLDMTNGPLVAVTKTTTTTKTVTTGGGGPTFNTCQDVTDYYDPKYKENPGDAAVVKNYYGRLANMKCSDHPMFIPLLEQYVVTAPSASKYYKLGTHYRKGGDYGKAIQYYNSALSNGDADAKTQGNIYYSMASAYYKQNKLSDARDAAEKAAAARPGWGAPWILVGGLYAKAYSSCGSNQLEKARAVWAAVDAYAKAKADPSSASDAQDRINKMTAYYPEKSEGFMGGVSEGQSVKAGCWIQRNTTARFK